MAWVAVDKDGRECIFLGKPKRVYGFWVDANEDSEDTQITFPRGSIKKLIGRDLTWKDEPVKLKEEQIV